MKKMCAFLAVAAGAAVSASALALPPGVTPHAVGNPTIIQPKRILTVTMKNDGSIVVNKVYDYTPGGMTTRGSPGPVRAWDNIGHNGGAFVVTDYGAGTVNGDGVGTTCDNSCDWSPFGGPPPGIDPGYRWYLSVDANNPYQAQMNFDDMSDIVGASSPIADIAHGWVWLRNRPGPENCMFGYFWYNEVVGAGGLCPAGAGPVGGAPVGFTGANDVGAGNEGIVIDYGPVPPGTFYYSLVDVSTVTRSDASPFLFPADSNGDGDGDGSYLQFIVNSLAGGVITPGLSASPMFWGTYDSIPQPESWRPGTNNDIGMADDENSVVGAGNMAGDFIVDPANNCYINSFGAAYCGLDPFAPLVGFGVTRCPSDYNGDGFPDAIDYDQFVSDWLGAASHSDMNGDCFSDAIDYDLFVGSWVTGC